jgi:hypothetical protein
VACTEIKRLIRNRCGPAAATVFHEFLRAEGPK